MEDIELPDLGDSAGAIISPEQEKKISQSFLRELRRQAPLVTDVEVVDYLTELGRTLSAQAEYDGTFHFCLIKSKAINAFAVPGGLICFNSGLILESTSEAELVSVLAHEISHVTQRHGARMIEAASKLNIPTMVAMVGAIALAAANPQAGYAAIMATQAAAAQYQINFTRANEREADAIGIKLMSKSGFDPNAMSDFFGRMQKASRYSDPKLVPEYLRTHPLSVNRIAEARSRAESITPEIIREENLEYSLVWAKLKVLSEPDPLTALHYFDELLKKTASDNNLAAKYGRAIAAREMSNFNDARKDIGYLIEEYPGFVSFVLEAAAIETMAGNYDRALTYSSKAYEMEPTERAAVYGLVQSLLILRKGEVAKGILDDYKFLEPVEVDPEFHKLLAESLDLMGKRVDSQVAMAEHYVGMGEVPLAAEQLRIARSSLDVTNYQRQKIVARLDQLEKEILAERGSGKNKRRR